MEPDTGGPVGRCGRRRDELFVKLEHELPDELQDRSSSTT